MIKNILQLFFLICLFHINPLEAKNKEGKIDKQDNKVHIKKKIHSLLESVVDIVVIDGNDNTSQISSSKSDGSGFIVSEEGLIVTNSHVIEEADVIAIVLHDQSIYIAKIIGKDDLSDIALLKIDVDKKLPTVVFSNSDKVDICDRVYAIGNPYGFGKSVTSGIISSKNRNLSEQMAEIGFGGGLVSYLQTDASISNGNSGGPLFDENGNAIGMITVFLSDGTRNTGINFAIPSNIVVKAIKQLKEQGKITRSWTGLTTNPLNKEVSDIILGEGKFGCDTVKIEPDSPAAKAGIQLNDIIISINGEKLKADSNIEYMLSNLPIKTPIKIELMRDKKQIALTIIPEIREEENIIHNDNLSKTNIPNEFIDSIGIGVTDITNELSQKFDIPNGEPGILISKISKELSELSVGNLILSVNQNNINSVAEFKSIMQQIIKSKERRIALQIYDPIRKQKRFYIVLRITYPTKK